MLYQKKIRFYFSYLFVIILLSSCGGDKAAKNVNSTNQAAVATAQKTQTPTVKTTTSTPKTTNPNTSNTTSSKKVVVSGKNVTTTSGGDFCVDVQVSNFIDIIAMQYSTNWDTKALQYKGVENFALKDLSKQSFGQGKGETNALRVSWFPNDLKGVTLYDGSTIYQVCFKAIGASGTNTEVKFTNKPIVAEIANSKYQKMQVDLKPVQIKIE